MYKFPCIDTIDDVLPHIKGREEFFVAERDGYTIINYTHQTPDTFPPMDGSNDLTHSILRECRGIAFASDGRLMSRPFHKFFNLNEKQEVSQENIIPDLSEKHYLVNKVDGSMVRPFFFDPFNNPSRLWRMATKMGFTDVADQADKYILNNYWKPGASWYNMHDFLLHCLNSRITPIFEWCSPKNKIVLNYNEDQLFLLAVRENYSGIYYSRDDLFDLVKRYNLPTLPTIHNVVNPNMNDRDLLDETVKGIRSLEHSEGYVLTWDNGQRIKIKSDWYIALHKTKEKVRQEKDVLALILDCKIDDLIPLLSEEDAEKVRNFERIIWKKIHEVSGQYIYLINNSIFDSMTPKEFALKVAPKLSVPSIGFTVFNKRLPVFSTMVAYCRKQCSNRKNVDNVRKLLGEEVRYEEIE